MSRLLRRKVAIGALVALPLVNAHFIGHAAPAPVAGPSTATAPSATTSCS